MNALPISIIDESLELDPSSKTWLRWKTRPLHHFKNSHGMNIWNARRSKKEAGAKMFSGNGKPYWKLAINGRFYAAHRVVFYMISGKDPGDMYIDHVDGNGLNNNPTNLRLATHVQNMMNRNANKNNKCGRKGVSWCDRTSSWVSRIRADGKGIHLGRFRDINKASEAYENASKEHFGDFHRDQPK